MMDFRFGTAINCIDGRTQEPVIDLKQKYNIDGVDMVTFPGVDGVISNGENSDEIGLIRNAVPYEKYVIGSKENYDKQ
jgi:carbonic anhydrase-like protein